MAYKGKKNERTLLEIILVGIFKAIWFLLQLPFKGLKVKTKGLNQNERGEIRTSREEIFQTMETGSEADLKQAVYEADKLVDHILKLKGYAGQTFADRLRSAESYIEKSVYNSIWEGHKIRNTLAHETKHSLTKSDYKYAIKSLIRYLDNY